VGLHTHPIEMRDVFVALIAIQRPILFDVLAYTYATLWFTTPFLTTSLVTSILVIAVSRRPASRRPHALP
jgi:hypothetical protein